MKVRMEFHHDAKNDVIVATPHGKAETEADVLDWYEQWVKYLKPFQRRMDVVIVLDHFTLSPAIGSVWGEYRAKIHKQFTRYSYRVHADSRVRLYSNTSGVRYDVAREEAASVEDGIEGIQAARLKDAT
jgi:hypothetical protein